MSAEFGSELERKLGRSGAWLRIASQGLLDHGSAIAAESDRWFLAALRGAARGAEQARAGLGALARAAATRSDAWRPAWSRPPTTRERLRRLLEREARRLDIDVSRPEFATFADKMSSLLHLVFSGALALEDIAFEAGDDRTSVEAPEEVAEREQEEQREEREPLPAPEPAAVADAGQPVALVEE